MEFLLYACHKLSNNCFQTIHNLGIVSPILAHSSDFVKDHK
jgi:hypothetical protein